MSATWTDQLAAFISGEHAPEIPEGALTAAAMVVADTVGVMIAGRRSPAGRVALEYLRSTAPGQSEAAAWQLGSVDSPTADTSAMVAGTLGHALDYDDTFPGAGHQAAVVLAAAVAAADPSRPLPGWRLLDAFVAGFEVSTTMARALGVGHYYKGWHMNCTAGTFGATAAACRIRNLDRDAVTSAIGIAGSLASGLQRNSGTMTKPFHSGFAARNGIVATQLAMLGASAAADVLDGDRGFFAVYGEGKSRPELLGAIGRPYALASPGTALKKYPCCYIAARPLDALLGLRAEYGLEADDVERVICRAPAKALYAMVYDNPQTGLEAKFSMEYILAAALVDGAIRLDTFTDAAVHRREVRHAMTKIVTTEDPQLRPEDPSAERSGPANGGQVEVVLRCTDGRELRRAVREPHGSPSNPFTWGDLRRKFLDCATFGGCAENRAEETLDGLRAIDALDDARQVFRPIALERPAEELTQSSRDGALR